MSTLKSRLDKLEALTGKAPLPESSEEYILRYVEAKWGTGDREEGEAMEEPVINKDCTVYFSRGVVLINGGPEVTWLIREVNPRPGVSPLPGVVRRCSK